MKINKEDFEDYVSGWLFTTEDFPNDLTMGNMKAALANALSQIECGEDGVKAVKERKLYYETTKTDN